MAKELHKISSLDFTMPDGAVDCHVHICDPMRFPYSSNRRYTPPPATVEDLRRFHSAIQIRRTVIVLPSVYGTDNAVLLDALNQLGKDARGIAVINEKFSGQQLNELAAGGVSGIRLNLEVGKERSLKDAARKLNKTVEKIAGRNWIIQIYATLIVIAGLARCVANQPNQVIFDHFAMAEAAGGIPQEGFSVVMSLMRSGKAYVKLSAPYQISKREDYSDISPIAKALIAASPDRIIWGSDWPHTHGAKRGPYTKPTDIEPYRNEDDLRNLRLVKTWTPDPKIRQKLFTDNPSRLFGFDA